MFPKKVLVGLMVMKILYIMYLEIQRCKEIVDKCSKNFIDLGTTPQMDDDVLAPKLDAKPGPGRISNPKPPPPPPSNPPLLLLLLLSVSPFD